MKERQRWKPEEDALLRSYVRQYGPREWNLVSQRMSVPFARDAKSCLERWKNYLKPGIKKGSLTEDEQRLVIRLQAKHGNKWKKIAAEVPGRTAKRLGKWWEVFKEKQHRELKDGSGPALAEPLDHVKYDHILESFAQKLLPPGGAAPAPPPAPEWRLPTPCPSVALTLAAAAPAGAAEVAELCSEMEEGRRGMAAQREEAAWRMRRVEMRLEAEKAGKRREKMEEVESRIRALREQQKHALEKMEAEYRDQLAGLRRDAEAKEAKLAEQWAARYARLTHFLHHMGYLSRPNNPSPSSSPGQ